MNRIANDGIIPGTPYITLVQKTGVLVATEKGTSLIFGQAAAR
jgi:hypothetical protein